LITLSARIFLSCEMHHGGDMIENEYHQKTKSNLQDSTARKKDRVQKKSNIAVHFPTSYESQLSGDDEKGLVLLAEDNEMVRDMIALMLEQLGYEVVKANDGMEALELFRERHNEICLVLSDIIMPRMDGWKTLAAIKGIRQDIPVLLISGCYEKGQVQTQKNWEKPQAVLQKPFTKKVLEEALDGIFSHG